MSTEWTSAPTLTAQHVGMIDGQPVLLDTWSDGTLTISVKHCGMWGPAVELERVVL